MRRLTIIFLCIIGLWGSAHADLDIHFIDVGQADAAVIICDGASMMIDGGNVGDSQLIYSYLKNTLKLQSLDVMIATHPHEDHIGGLAAALNCAPANIIYSPVTEYESVAFANLKKYATSDLTVPDIGEHFQLGSAVVTIINVSDTAYETVNDWSIVARIDYGETSFLFTGDASTLAEADMLANNVDLNCDVLKVGHHGSTSSSTTPFLQAVSPDYAIISVGKENQYGLPNEVVLQRLISFNTTIYRTDQSGTIICHSDGSTITFTTETIPDADPQKVLTETNDPEYRYIGNKNSHKIHESHCSSVNAMKDKNKVYFHSYEEAIALGYEPCQSCIA